MKKNRMGMYAVVLVLVLFSDFVLGQLEAPYWLWLVSAALIGAAVGATWPLESK